MRRDVATTNKDAVVKTSRHKKILMLGGAILSIIAVLALVSMLLANPRLLSANADSISPYVTSGDGTQQNVLTMITWYDYNQNTGSDTSQQGSSEIAYPKNGGYPTIHNEAMEGSGTYTDPITFAAPDKDLKTNFPIGSIIYVPVVKKYFIMEDQCSDSGCESGANHVNLWMGPANPMDSSTIAACIARATPNTAVYVTLNPSANLSVDTTAMYTSDNQCTLKLYPDVQVTGSPTASTTAVPTTTPTTTPTVTETPTATETPIATVTPTATVDPSATVTGTSSIKAPATIINSPYVKSGDGTQQSVSTVITWYGYNDNSGETESQYGSADIAYPKNGGYPTLDNQAHEGTGTYSDPVTFAAPNKDLKTTFPIGSIIYVPLVRKYFIMEDECGDDDPTGCQNGTNHADLWMGPAQAMNGTSLDNCESSVTPNGSSDVTINPSSTLPVDTTVMYTSSNQCTIKTYP
jgi:hypothetical protein